jgi:multiple sugar transport system ATP-binding protein
VRLVEHLGADMLVHLDVAGAPRPVVLRVAPRDGLRLAKEQTVHAAAAPEQILLFGAGGERLRARGTTVVPLRGHA